MSCKTYGQYYTKKWCISSWLVSSREDARILKHDRTIFACRTTQRKRANIIGMFKITKNVYVNQIVDMYKLFVFETEAVTENNFSAQYITKQTPKPTFCSFQNLVFTILNWENYILCFYKNVDCFTSCLLRFEYK